MCRDFLTGIERTFHDHPMVIVEIQEMERALDEFKAAVERGETVGNLSRGMIKE